MKICCQNDHKAFGQQQRKANFLMQGRHWGFKHIYQEGQISCNLGPCCVCLCNFQVTQTVNSLAWHACFDHSQSWQDLDIVSIKPLDCMLKQVLSGILRSHTRGPAVLLRSLICLFISVLT